VKRGRVALGSMRAAAEAHETAQQEGRESGRANVCGVGGRWEAVGTDARLRPNTQLSGPGTLAN